MNKVYKAWNHMMTIKPLKSEINIRTFFFFTLDAVINNLKFTPINNYYKKEHILLKIWKNPEWIK